ncbi:MAG: hypothetical protein UY63_C0011G0011 [Parcubacteria group bacterium GW2011_GWA2_51_10]|nr:MAG: hypothetical protein UY63_C0011G0011 [Parcubacteria group bacterium GW2011_GWA2_51_10]
MQFQVPQFIEVEDKIFGPFTFRQFVYIAGGLGAAYLLSRILPLFIAAPLVLVVAALAAALAFLKLNGRPFISALEHGFFYFVRAKLYLWSNKRKAKPAVMLKEGEEEKSLVYVPRLSDSKLHDLAWSLDIKERLAEGEASEQAHFDTLAPVRTAREAMRK